jgi:hypothetical protein
MTITRGRAALSGALLFLAVAGIMIAAGPPAAGTARATPPTPTSFGEPERAMCDEGHDPMPGSCPIPLDLQAPPEEDVTGHYHLRELTATAGLDFQWVENGRFTIARGATTVEIPVGILGDSRCERDESFLLEIYSVSGGAAVTPPRTEVIIVNDDAC